MQTQVIRETAIEDSWDVTSHLQMAESIPVHMQGIWTTEPTQYKALASRFASLGIVYPRASPALPCRV